MGVPSYKNVANSRYANSIYLIIQRTTRNTAIFFDDASQDDTPVFLREYIKEHSLSPSIIQVASTRKGPWSCPACT